MDSTATTPDLKVKVTNKQILTIALPITLAILIPQINLLTNSIFLGDLSTEALGNAGITGVFYLIFAVAGHGLNNALQAVFSRYAGSDNPEAFKNHPGTRHPYIAAVCSGRYFNYLVYCTINFAAGCRS